ncbi:unnamed protein product [Ectocarpus sp. 8 AP-2014]
MGYSEIDFLQGDNTLYGEAAADERFDGDTPVGWSSSWAVGWGYHFCKWFHRGRTFADMEAA